LTQLVLPVGQVAVAQTVLQAVQHYRLLAPVVDLAQLVLQVLVVHLEVLGVVEVDQGPMEKVIT
jgi:hypothetical protein